MAATFLKRAQLVVLLVLATLLPLVAIAQGQIHYDHKARVDQQNMEALYVKTIQCMRGSTLAMLRQGITGRDDVMKVNLQFCARPLYQHLTGTMKWEARDAANFMLSINDKTVEAVAKGLM